VVGLDEGEPCRAATEEGHTVVARDVVVPTHYPVFDRALLFSRLSPRRELVVAGPIPAERDPGGIFITPKENTRSVRTAPYRDGERLLIVTGEHFTPGTADVTERFEPLLTWTRDRFPGVNIAYRWAAQDNSTTDGLPFIGPFHPGAKHVHVATGFGGWGMSNGIMAGQMLAAAIAGDSLPWSDPYDPRRLHPLREAGPMLKLQATVARHFLGDRVRASHVDSLDEIAVGTGAVIRLGGEQLAVYRDETGALQALSARCTHLGCIVHFNDAEHAWECPCHGSRVFHSRHLRRESAARPRLAGPGGRPRRPSRSPWGWRSNLLPAVRHSPRLPLTAQRALASVPKPACWAGLLRRSPYPFPRPLRRVASR
jgi:hypothetical protein